MIDQDLNDAQADFCESDFPETMLMGGWGVGKSFSLGCLGYEAAMLCRGSVTLIASPTMDTLKNATMRQIITKCWEEKLGLEEGRHFVINQQPPEGWNVKPFTKLSNTRIVTWVNGSYTILDSLENYTKHVGTEYDRILVDEFQNVTPEARTFLLGRLRGSAFEKAGFKHQLFYALTPPTDADSLEHLIMLLENPKLKTRLKLVRGSSYMNAENLPEDYIESLTQGLDDKAIQRNVYGEIVKDLAGRFAYGFKPEIHVSKEAEWDSEHPVYFWFDFNIGKMACIVVQFGEDWIKVIDEFKPEHEIDIDGRCDKILESRYAEQLWSCQITGDPAKGRTGINANVDYYTRIAANLDLEPNQLKIRKNHPFIKDSQQLLNTLLNRFPKFIINQRCEWLIRDLEYCVTDNKGDLDKTNPDRTHYLDALRYGLDYHFIWFLANKRDKKVA